MLPLDDRGKRITENIFDIIMENSQYDAQFNFNVDTADLNLFVDKHAGLIMVEDQDGDTVYTIEVKRQK